MKHSLLLADGDAELCDLYEMFFMEQGFEIETAWDGLDCLRKLRLTAPTVLVLDLDLRWGGGDGVLACLREESLAHGVPVILTSTSGFPFDLAEFTESPVVAYLPKPFAVIALLESVHDAIAKSGRFEPSHRNRVRAYSEHRVPRYGRTARGLIR